MGKNGELVGGSTHLKNISQIGNLPQIGVKKKHIWNHHLENWLHNALLPIAPTSSEEFENERVFQLWCLCQSPAVRYHLFVVSTKPSKDWTKTVLKLFSKVLFCVSFCQKGLLVLTFHHHGNSWLHEFCHEAPFPLSIPNCNIFSHEFSSRLHLGFDVRHPSSLRYFSPSFALSPDFPPWIFQRPKGHMVAWFRGGWRLCGVVKRHKNSGGV